MYEVMNCDDYGCDVIYETDSYKDAVTAAEEFDSMDVDIEIVEMNNA